MFSRFSISSSVTFSQEVIIVVEDGFCAGVVVFDDSWFLLSTIAFSFCCNRLRFVQLSCGCSFGCSSTIPV